MEDFARKTKNPHELLGLSGEITLDRLNSSYTKQKKAIEDGGSGDGNVTLLDLEWAYKELLRDCELDSQKDTSRQKYEEDECALSAALIPGLSMVDFSELSHSADENVVYLTKRSGATTAADPIAFVKVDAPVKTTQNQPSRADGVRTKLPYMSPPPKTIVRVRADSACSEDAHQRLMTIVKSNDPVTGGVLKKLRQEIGLEIDEIHSKTKIAKKYLIALEEDNFEELPAPVYFRGFLISYMKFMGLDNPEIAESFNRHFISKSKRRGK